MTTVFIHGYLGQKYGKKHCFSLSKPRDVFRALECSFEGFNKEIIELGKNGCQYTLVVDDRELSNENDLSVVSKMKTIHIVPTIFGAGVAALVVGALAAIGGVALGGTATLIGSMLLAVAFSAISFGLQSLLTKPPQANAISQSNPNQSTAATSATSKSFLFSNRENVASQGNPIPLAYGRLRVGSAIIQENIKSYPNSVSTFDEFASQSLEEGQSYMSIVHNQQI
jgi:predicted phage tail protein